MDLHSHDTHPTYLRCTRYGPLSIIIMILGYFAPVSLFVMRFDRNAEEILNYNFNGFFFAWTKRDLMETLMLTLSEVEISCLKSNFRTNETWKWN